MCVWGYFAPRTTPPLTQKLRDTNLATQRNLLEFFFRRNQLKHAKEVERLRKNFEEEISRWQDQTGAPPPLPRSRLRTYLQMEVEKETNVK